jgi:predicted ester cyclase
MDFYRIADERIAENWQIIDMTALRKQIESIGPD